jgi:hypothetical protein
MSNEILLVPHKLSSDYKVWVFIADLHSGSLNGINPEPRNSYQDELLKRYQDAILWTGPPPDVVVAVGDVTEGVDPRWLPELGDEGGETKLVKQFAPAAKLLSMWKAKEEYIIVTGTKAHSGVGSQNFEPAVATALERTVFEQTGDLPKVSVRRKLKTTINDWFLLEARHFIGRSVIPHGRATAPLRSQMWNVMNAAIRSYEEEKPAHYPQLIVFGHTHYYMYAENAWGSTMILPCWKAAGDAYGDELMDGHIDLGIVKVIVGPSKEVGWAKAPRLYSASVVSRTESR